MITDPLKLFVVEYSMTQDAMHVRTLKNVIANNLNNLGNGKPCDYVPIGLFETRDHADQFYFRFRQGIDDLADTLGKRPRWPQIRDLAVELLPGAFSPFVLREA